MKEKEICKRLDERMKSIEEKQKPLSYEVRVSVRQLVEFILRNGDIDNRRTSSMENAMQEGSRLHRMIQRRMGSEYEAEVMLKYQYITPDYTILVEGRADGIITKLPQQISGDKLPENQLSLGQFDMGEEMPQVTIDEIKCVARDLEYVTAPVEVHLAQAKVYAFIYATQQNLPMIRVRMTYCNIETEELKYFTEEYTRIQLTEWFEDLMNQYKKWADFQYQWGIARQNSIKNLQFPFPYRKGQRELAVYVYQTIKEKKKLFMEAPTGVGKTLSTVFPAVKSMGEGLTERIFYLTAKTITRTVAEDSVDIMREKGLSLKSLTITAKEKVCPLDKAECNPAVCPRAKGHYDRINDAIYQAITESDRIDRSVIERVATEYEVCPFELSLDVSLFSDMIICDYNYVFDPHVSLKRFFADGNKGDYAFLIDEAHNLVDRGREMFSAVLVKEDFLALKRELNYVLERQPLTRQLKSPSVARRLVNALERCNKELLGMKKKCEDCLVLENADTFSGYLESLYTAMDQFLEEEEDSPIRQDVLEFYFEVSHFLLIYEKVDSNYIIYCKLQEDDTFALKLFCVNPRINLQEAMARGRSSILFSATLLPIQYHKQLLGGEATDYEAYAETTFSEKQRGLFIARDVTSKYTRRNEQEFRNIAAYIYEIIQAKTGNYMIFFPSHSFLSHIYEVFMEYYFNEETMDCVVQEEYMKEEQREEFLQAFEENAVANSADEEARTKKSLIGFCVLGGIFSEGIDLKKDSLIGAVIVGTGLPQVCSERELLKEFFDEENGNGFDYAYRFPGMNKVLQAAGRVIRTADDVGIVALLDERFVGNSYRKLFPREWKNYQVVNQNTIGEEVQLFWENVNTTFSDD